MSTPLVAAKSLRQLRNSAPEVGIGEAGGEACGVGRLGDRERLRLRDNPPSKGRRAAISRELASPELAKA
jgi:hypothetical protein